ncbi:hypothetical protein [Catenuloplanes japonicus]|uniref:hypothetical protein n=1 Tax=Catenuloplanes japonicus TaxID=33876 RepID=UPI00052759E4|nr:hypothetical protein [Catenuloplanes japonicus]
MSGPVVDLDIASVAEDPGRRGLYGRLDGIWPKFMMQDPTSGLYFGDHLDAFPDHVLVAVDRATGEPVARGLSVPLAFDGDIAAGLPEDGWDWAIRSGVRRRLSGAAGTVVSALEILVRPDLRGAGLSGIMLAEMRARTAAQGFGDLIAPVRPNGKHLQPLLSIDEYAFAVRPDGLPVDPWLRVHVRAGGRIVNVAHSSMVMVGTLGEWRRWTGLPFDGAGAVVVPEALVPVHCDPAQDVAVYVEPNVWVHHVLS